jgi:hypothetical protein
MALLTRINEDQKNLMDLYKEMKGDYQKLLLKMDHIEESLDISRYLPTTTTTRSQLPQQCTPQPPTATSSLLNNPGPAVLPLPYSCKSKEALLHQHQLHQKGMYCWNQI